jgi:hypothetical protein
MKKISTLIVACLLAACASAQTKAPSEGRPDWVDGKTEGAYPASKYMTAVGNGSSREAAVQSAKNALASSFLQKVESETASESRAELSENTSAQSSGEASSKSRSAVQISTNIQLRGAEVVQYWQDPATGETYALAVLNKLKVRNSYLMDLTRQREKLQSLNANFKANPSHKTGKEILEQAKAYADLSREAAAIGTPQGATDPVSQTELQAIQEKLNDLKHSKPIAIELASDGDVAGQQAADLKALIANCLQEKGYAVAENAGAAAGKFAGAYRVSSKHLKVEGFNKFDFSVKAAFSREKHSEKIFLQKSASGREQDQAFDSVKGELSEGLCAALVQAM